MEKTFKDKVVWITGGGSGIGLALALEFARQGARVAISGRRADRLEDAVKLIDAAGGSGFTLACDVADEEQVKSAVQSIVEKWGRLDVAIANAGFALAGRVEKLTAEDWRRQLDVNVVGTAITCRYAIPELRKTSGRIGLIGSISAMLASPGFPAYTASKYAVRAIGQCLALELHGSGVSCTTVHPGYVESDIAKVDNMGNFDPSRVDKRPKKMMWKADAAARVIVRAIAKRKREHTFTGHGKLAAWAGRHAPSIVHLAMRGDSKRRKRPKRPVNPGR